MRQGRVVVTRLSSTGSGPLVESGQSQAAAARSLDGRADLG